MNKILIVDDNPSDLKVLEKLLIKKGFDVCQASDAYNALELMDKDKYDLVILDWMMPKINGLEILRTIRSNPALKLIPAIFVTSKNEAKDIKKAIDQGITDYLIKPLDPMILESKIAKILKREDGWKMSPLFDREESNSIIKTRVQILGISEIAIQFRCNANLRPYEILQLDSDTLKNIGISEVQIRIHECHAEQNGFVALGILIGLKESELKAIRQYANSNNNLEGRAKLEKAI